MSKTLQCLPWTLSLHIIGVLNEESLNTLSSWNYNDVRTVFYFLFIFLEQSLFHLFARQAVANEYRPCLSSTNAEICQARRPSFTKLLHQRCIKASCCPVIIYLMLGKVWYCTLGYLKKEKQDVGKLVLSTVHSDNFRERSSPRGKTLMDIGLFWTEVEPNHFFKVEKQLLNQEISGYIWTATVKSTTPLFSCNKLENSTHAAIKGSKHYIMDWMKHSVLKHFHFC